MVYFAKIEKSILKFTRKYKRPHIPKATLSKRNNIGNITLPTSNCIYRAIITKIECYLHKKK
jgi:hypothetical protein